MGPKFAVRDNSVNQHGSNLQTSEDQMNQRAKAFIEAIAPLESSWKGTSFGSWQELTNAWNEAMAGLNKALTDVKSRVGNAGSLYDQYHNEQTEALAKTMGGADFAAAKFNA